MFARSLAAAPRRVLCAVLFVPWAVAASAGVTTLDFDGSLPAGAAFERPSPALDAHGTVVSDDVPRFQVGAVTAGATLVRALPVGDTMLGTAQLAGVQYSLVRLGTIPALTTGEPGANPPPVYALPDGSVIGNFGAAGSAWGLPQAAEIFPDGVVVLHTMGTGAEFRQMTLRTTLASFSDPDGFTIVRVSDYRPPSAGEMTGVGAASPRRPVFLPHLGVWASTVSEYFDVGLVSSVYPGAGRSLGYASTDEGLTWQRVIDSDLDVPDRVLQPVPKHMHHLEPFEWFDESAAAWKIGVVAVLGDTPNQGQVIARAHGATLPDLSSESYASVARWKVVGVDQLTDLFPLSSSGTPSGGPVFLDGTDGTQGGMATMSLIGDAETDTMRFRPTVTLARKPYVLQLNRLGTGAIVAGTATFADAPTYFAQGFLTSDAQGLHWATAYLAHHLGFRGIMPVGQNRFWTLSARDDGAYYENSLWELPGPPSVRSALVLEPPASDVPVAAPFATDGSVSVTVVTDVAPPVAVGGQRPILRVRSETLSTGQRFDSFATQALSATRGQSVQVSFWVKPLRADMGVAAFKTRLELTSPSGGTTSSDALPVKLDLNDWTPIVLRCRVPAAGTARAAALFAADENASSSLPLDYYFTEPQFVVSDQPTIATQRRAATTAGDHLTVNLPALQSEWSVAIWTTEAPTVVLSLLGSDGSQALVQQTDIPSVVTSFAGSSTLAFSFFSPTSGNALVGEAARRNVVVPTQDLVVITKSQSGLTLYVARGMGPIETLQTGAGSGFTPTSLQFGTPTWSRQFEGTVHRVKVWDDAALDLAGVEAERVSIPPPVPRPPPTGCGLGPELALLVPALMCLRRRTARA